MEDRGIRLTVPVGFYTRCAICHTRMESGTKFYRVNGRDVCLSCEGKAEPKMHREPRTTAEWMKFEVG
jgi:recombinational DNA repair protein (RecF pathway)